MQILKTLCTRCQAPIICEWPDKMTFGGDPVTPAEYMSKALQSERVLVVCNNCLAEMPDVKLEDMRLAG